MPLTGSILAELRATVLDGIATRATAAGITLDVSEGSDAWKEADTLASLVLAYEGHAERLAADIDPRTASAETLARWFALMQLAAGDGVAGAYTVSVTGRDGTHALGARVLNRGGHRYAPRGTEVVISGGTGSLTVEAEETGTDAALTVGATLRWDAAPLGLDPTASVTVIATTPQDADGTEDQRAAVLSRLRARPSGGNPAQIKALAEQHQDCVVAYVYPCLAPHPDGQGSASTWLASRLDTPGAFTVLILGAAQGSDPVAGGTHNRARSTTQASNVRAFLHGTQSATRETLAASAGQRFSTQVLPEDVAVAVGQINVVNVDVQITPTQGATPSWSGTMTVTTPSTTTVTVAGDQSAKEGLDALFFVGIAAARGGWVRRTITLAAFGGVNTVLTVETLPAAATGTVYPVLGHWEALRDAFFAFFDAQGPGDVPSATSVRPAVGTSRRRRFPPLSWEGKSTVAKADALRLAFAAEGSLDASVVSPSADVGEEPFRLNVLGTLLLRPA